MQEGQLLHPAKESALSGQGRSGLRIRQFARLQHLTGLSDLSGSQLAREEGKHGAKEH